MNALAQQDVRQKMTLHNINNLPGCVCDIRKVDREYRRYVVYLIEAGPSKVKVGVTVSAHDRVREVLRTGGETAKRIAVTRAISNAYSVEAAFKRRFSAVKIIGEWHSVRFETARKFLEDHSWIGNQLSHEEHRAASEVRRKRFDDFMDVMLNGLGKPQVSAEGSRR